VTEESPASSGTAEDNQRARLRRRGEATAFFVCCFLMFLKLCTVDTQAQEGPSAVGVKVSTCNDPYLGPKSETCTRVTPVRRDCAVEERSAVPKGATAPSGTAEDNQRAQLRRRGEACDAKGRDRGRDCAVEERRAVPEGATAPSGTAEDNQRARLRRRGEACDARGRY
jgi:hypothetical protein